jgi:hypothetical protein
VKKKDLTKMEYEETEFLYICALRFDGYKYWQERCRNFGVKSNNLTPLTVKLVATREFFTEPFDNFAAFFALQRYLGKWGGEYLTEFSEAHIVFCQLFLHLYREEVPSEFRIEDYYAEWQRKYEPIKEQLAAQIRRNFRRKGRGAKIRT